MKIKFNPVKIPETIMKKVEGLADKNKRREIAEKKRVEKEHTQTKGLEDLRKLNWVQLNVHAREILHWIYEFVRSPDGKKFFKQVHTIRIFCASFWLGFPVKEAYSTTFATIEVDRHGNVSYNERYKGMPAHTIKLGKIPIVPETLVEKLHPDYLVQLAEHLLSGAVWNYIETAMPEAIDP